MENQKKYNTIEELLSDESFTNWIRYNEDSIKWEKWISENAERAELIEEARIWALALKVEEFIIPEEETRQALENTWQKIEKSTHKRQIFLTKWFWLRAGAAFLVISLSYFLITQTKSSSISYHELIKQEPNKLIEKNNYSNKPVVITLSDGSSVILQPNSKISYPKTFTNNERKIYLSGEGFFEIAKDAQKPFYVYSHEVVTKVLGTSFRVIAYPNQSNIEVFVRTGKVKVLPNKKIKNITNQELLLLPNQAIRFSKEKLSFEKILNFKINNTLSASTNPIEKINFEFEDTPVEQIFKAIEEAYLVKIDYSNQLKNCYLTTSLSDEPLAEKLKIICKSLGNNSHFEINEDQIKIISTGCN
ncbi:FecR family protein [Emticicia sp. 17c]|uniref:FecR family protein n=1 Tax=Emticicia sp. 17c TaxID=3127704 RepID=UPI00301E0EE9